MTDFNNDEIARIKSLATSLMNEFQNHIDKAFPEVKVRLHLVAFMDDNVLHIGNLKPAEVANEFLSQIQNWKAEGDILENTIHAVLDGAQVFH